MRKKYSWKERILSLTLAASMVLPTLAENMGTVYAADLTG